MQYPNYYSHQFNQTPSSDDARRRAEQRMQPPLSPNNGNPGGANNTGRFEGMPPSPNYSQGFDPRNIQFGNYYGGQSPYAGRYRPPTMGGSGRDPGNWNDYGGYNYNLPNAFGDMYGGSMFGNPYYGGFSQGGYGPPMPTFPQSYAPSWYGYGGGMGGGQQGGGYNQDLLREILSYLRPQGGGGSSAPQYTPGSPAATGQPQKPWAPPPQVEGPMTRLGNLARPRAAGSSSGDGTKPIYDPGK